MLKKGRSFYQLDYHLIFGTKNKIPSISRETLSLLKNSFDEIANEMDFKIYIMNGYLDHIHLLLTIPPKHAIADVVQKIKGRSSHALKIQWQEGYGIFAVERLSFPRISSYIKDQEIHHKHGADFIEEIEKLQAS